MVGGGEVRRWRLTRTGFPRHREKGDAEAADLPQFVVREAQVHAGGHHGAGGGEEATIPHVPGERVLGVRLRDEGHRVRRRQTTSKVRRTGGVEREFTTVRAYPKKQLVV